MDGCGVDIGQDQIGSLGVERLSQGPPNPACRSSDDRREYSSSILQWTEESTSIHGCSVDVTISSTVGGGRALCSTRQRHCPADFELVTRRLYAEMRVPSLRTRSEQLRSCCDGGRAMTPRWLRWRKLGTVSNGDSCLVTHGDTRGGVAHPQATHGLDDRCEGLVPGNVSQHRRHCVSRDERSAHVGDEHQHHCERRRGFGASGQEADACRQPGERE